MSDPVVDYDYLIEIQVAFIQKQMALDEIMWVWIAEWDDEH